MLKRELSPQVIVSVIVVGVLVIGGLYFYMMRPVGGTGGRNSASVIQASKGPMPQQTSIPKYTGP